MVAAALMQKSYAAAAVRCDGEGRADTLAVAPPPSNSLELPAKLKTLGANNPAPAGTAAPPKSAFDRTHVGTKGAAVLRPWFLQN